METTLDPSLVGPAGEAFVEFDLLRRGVRVHRSVYGSGYDLIAEVGGRLLRVEVKATRDLRLKDGKLTYEFAFAGSKKRTYLEVEVFAFVALDIPAVVYIHGMDLGSRGGRKTLGKSRFAQTEESFVECFGSTKSPASSRLDVAGQRRQNPVLATNVVTGEVLAFPSVASAVAAGFTSSGISLALSGRIRAHRGHTFTRDE